MLFNYYIILPHDISYVFQHADLKIAQYIIYHCAYIEYDRVIIG